MPPEVLEPHPVSTWAPQMLFWGKVERELSVLLGGHPGGCGGWTELHVPGDRVQGVLWLRADAGLKEGRGSGMGTKEQLL